MEFYRQPSFAGQQRQLALPQIGFVPAKVSGCGDPLSQIAGTCGATASTTQPVAFTSPIGGEQWAVGSTHTITWNTTGLNSDNVQIGLINNSGTVDYFDTVQGNQGSYVWTIGAGKQTWQTPGNYNIIISYAGGCAGNSCSGAYGTSASFSIVAASVTTVQVGQLVYSPGDRTIYLVASNGLYGFTDAQTFYNWGLSFNNILPENSAERALQVLGNVPAKLAGCSDPLSQINGTCGNSSASLQITTASLPNATVGQAYGGTIAFSYNGSAVINISISGLPAGLQAPASIGNSGPVGGSIIDFRGLPTTAGTYPITVSLNDSAGASANQQFTLVVNPAQSNTAIRVGQLVFTNGGTVYLVGQNGLYGIPTIAVFNSWGWTFGQVVQANSAEQALSQIGIVPSRDPNCSDPISQINGTCGSPTVGGLTFYPASLSLNTGQTATVQISSGVNMSAYPPYFASSSNPTIAAVSISGTQMTISGAAVGSTIISVCLTGGNTCGNFPVTITAGPKSTVAVSPTSLTFGYNYTSTSNPPSQAVAISGGDFSGASVTDPLIIQVSSNSLSWLGVSATAQAAGIGMVAVPGNSTFYVSVQVPIGTPPGTSLTLSGNILINNINSSISPVAISIPVTFTISSSGQISVPLSPTLSPSSPLSQFVVGGATNQAIATYNFTSTAAETIQQMTFNVSGTGITSVSAGGMGAVVVNGTATINGLNLSVPAGYSGLNVPVTASYAQVGANGVPSGQSVSVTLSGVKYTNLVSGITANVSSNIASNKMTLVGSYPSVVLSNPTGAAGGNTVMIAKVAVSANAAGNIVLTQLPLNISSSGSGAVGNFSVIDDATGQTAVLAAEVRPR